MSRVLRVVGLLGFVWVLGVGVGALLLGAWSWLNVEREGWLMRGVVDDWPYNVGSRPRRGGV